MLRARRRVAALTLIELLIVVAILALLISILLPALASAKSSAYRVRCATNIRQLITAMVAYANDSEEALPLANWAKQDPGPGWLYSPPTTYLPDERHTGTLWRYLLFDALYRCPRHEQPYARSALLTSYLVNGAVAGYGRIKGSFQITAFRPEALIVWEAGETQWNDGSSYPNEGLTRRHGDGATLGGIDGHTEWMTHAQYNFEVQKTTPGKLWCAPDTKNGR